MHIKVSFPSALFLTIAFFALSGCTEEGLSNRDYPFDAYQCKENCVPVRFVVHVPQNELFSSRIYLSGTFNNWVHGEKVLKLNTHSDLLEKEYNILGKTVQFREQGAYRKHWIEIELPEGASIKYRYTRGESSNGGYPDEVAFRTATVQSGLVLADSVLQWGKTAVQTRRAEYFAYDQDDYLRFNMSSYTLPTNHGDPLETVLGAAETLWKEEGMRLMPGYPHIFARSYYSLFYSHQNNGNIPTDPSTECRMHINYLLPAYQRELDYALKHITKEDTRFRHVASTSAIFQSVLCDSLSESNWHQIETIFYETIPNELASFKNSSDEDLLQSIDYFTRSMLDAYAPDFAFQRAINDNDLETARQIVNEVVFNPPAAGIKIKHTARRQQYLPKTLALKYAKQGQVENALDVLDEIASHTSEIELPSDTLQSWYSQVAGNKGLDRIKQVGLSGSRKPMTGSGPPISLEGTYLNVSDGTEFDLSVLQGKTVVLYLWATWCYPCVKDIPNLKAFQDKLQARDDVAFLTVSLDATSGSDIPVEDLKELLKKQDVNFTVLYDAPDNAFSSQFTIDYVPTKYLIDKTGRVITELYSLDDVSRALK